MTTDLDSAALFAALESVIRYRCKPFMSPPYADASFRRNPRDPAPPIRSRSPTLPLDEEADGAVQGTDSRQPTPIYENVGHQPRINATSKTTARTVQNQRSKTRPVLKPVVSRITKESPNRRSVRHKFPYQQKKDKCSTGKWDLRITRQDVLQKSRFPASIPSSSLNNRLNPPGRRILPHRASIARYPDSAKRSIRETATALENKPFIKINAEPRLSSACKRRRPNPAQEKRGSAQENKWCTPEYKTRSGRVSKRPMRLGYA
jgi:hypothetical protein